ncbi:uncharacterized protein PGRI_083790 [Penicillium griseofulvum]|uniref:Uncharacterized protein n=1 Tax=Penicillium patulum TaxID=5078 RepID=A0A135LT06_PENPA|nr:uncharacterized protein PGRI_083790 [Penicillium griseofulvum]KXG52095.1 hypothetical protein PGRI_083790 [Penicillium griseofulvum]
MDICKAASEGHANIVQLLLDQGADVNAQDGKNGTALQAAALEGHAHIVRLLLDQGADVNAQGGWYGTALQAASLRGHGEVVQMLLDQGADINARGGEDGTALHSAALGGHPENIRLRLKRGADVNAQGGEDGTALHRKKFARPPIKSGFENTMWRPDAMREYGPHKKKEKSSLSPEQESRRDEALYNDVPSPPEFEEGTSSTFPKKDGTALHAAALGGHTETIRLLLERGADVNAQGGEDGTALYAAALRGHTETIQLLLERGADINAQGGEDGMALYAAASRGHTETVRLLLDQSADFNARNGEDRTALHAAALGGHTEIVLLLLLQGADVNAQSSEDGTALQAAALGGHTEIVLLLLQQGADANAQGGQNGTAFQAAASQGHTEILQVILSRQGYTTPITEENLKAILNNSNALQLMTSILAYQADKIIITEEVLMAAAQNPRGVQLMALLLESSAKISEEYIWVRDLEKVGYSYQEIIDLLLEDRNDSPWFSFESTYSPDVKVQPGRHVQGCCHQISPYEARPMQIFDPKFENDITNDHHEIILQIQEFCGLAGIKPTTPRVTEWVGYIEFNKVHQVLTVSYTLPTEGSNPPDVGTIWSRISRALDGLYHAVALMQANNLCCNSFTVLKSGFQGHEPSSSSLVEIISVSFKSVLVLIEELQNVINPASKLSDTRKLLSASTAILGLIWQEIPDAPGDSSMEWSLHVCALAVQFLCLGFLSYSQAHIEPLRPFFLDFFAQQVRLMGLHRDATYPFLVAELVNLTCLGNMTRGKVLLFRASKDPLQKQSLETQSQQVIQKHDVLGHTENILDTWGPGNLILRGDGSRAPVAIKIGDGFIFAHEGAKFHWSQQMPGIEGLRSIEMEQSLLIGSLVAVNAACKPIEADSRIISANLLEELGTSRSLWQKSQRQLGIQGGQYVVCQATETWNKQTGIPVKDRALSYPSEVLIQYLDYYWGVQVSYCTGVAKRVRLRKLVADLVQHFSAGSAFNFDTLEAKMNDETLRPKDLQIWLSSLGPDIRAELLNIICDILNTLRHTGLDSTETYFCVAWPFEGNITQFS